MANISNQAKFISDKKVFPTSLSSKDIRLYWSEQLRRQSLFSAHTTSKTYLDKVKEVLLEYIDGVGLEKDSNGNNVEMYKDVGRSTMLLREKLEELGLLKRENGVIIEQMQNLGSQMRLKLIVKTNAMLAHSMAMKMSSEDPLQKIINPAWEFVRYESREMERDWWSRWIACADKVDYKGVVDSSKTTRMIALTTSPIWHELGHGFTDSLDTDVPPFAFGSGMSWMPVSRTVCKTFGLVT